MTVEIHYTVDTNEFHKAVKQVEGKVKEANRRASDKLGKRALQLFRGITRTWTHQPEFTSITNEAGDNIEVLTGTDDKIFGWLDRGTPVRYAIMSPDFVAKTKPGSLRSEAGRGRVIFVSRKHPRPGIQARNFSKRIEEIISREAEPAFNREIRNIR